MLRIDKMVDFIMVDGTLMLSQGVYWLRLF